MSARLLRPSLVLALFGVALGGLLSVAGLAEGGGAARGEGAPDPAATLEGWSSGWYARVETSLGAILIRLLPEQAPQCVAHFAALAEGRLAWRNPYTGEESTAPYYDGVIVHKVVLAQHFEVGDHTASGRGSPPIFVPFEGKGPETFSRPYRVGLTRMVGGKISGVLFFVTTVAQPELAFAHPCFGVVVEGKEVAEKITRVRTNRRGRPLEPIRVERVRILKAGDPPPLPEPVPFEPEALDLAPKL